MPVADVEALLHQVEMLDRLVLVALAERGRQQPTPPTFHGRCLDPAYLEAVAAGCWSPDDEALLLQAEDRLEARTLPRVRVLDRRALRSVLRGTVLAVLTQDLPVTEWEPRRQELAAAWLELVGPLPHTSPPPLATPAQRTARDLR